MHRGYIKMWRKCIDSGILQNAELWQLFSYILLNATHKNIKQAVGKQVVNLQAGQVIVGRISLSEKLKVSQQKIRTNLKILENLQIINQQTTNKYTIVSIINWDTYQQEQPANNQQPNQQVTNNQPTSNQQVTTNKNVNNIRTEENNKKKRERATPSPPKLTFGEFGNVKLTEQEYQNLHERFNSHADEKIKALDLYIGSKGDKYKSHYMTILQWAKKDEKQEPKKQDWWERGNR